MNKVMEWIKGHWIVLAMMGGAIVALPVMVYFASSMSASAKTKIEGEIKTDWSDMTSGAKVTYRVPPLLAGGKTLEESKEAPNPSLTEWFKAALTQQAEEAAAVVARAVALNKANHGFLVPGLFPDPKGNDQLLRVSMARQFTTEAHGRLLAAIGAGAPPDAAALAAELQSYQLEELKAITGSDKPDINTLGQADKDKLATKVLSKRVGQYQAKAARIAVYADVGVFRLPPFSESPPPSIEQCWSWQNEFWIHEDILAAVAMANQGAAGVPGAVIKRIESITVDDFPGIALGAPGGLGEPRPGETPAATPPPAGEAPTDFTRSVTGRFSGPGSNNGLYDVRTARLTVIASTRNLPKFFDALGRVNFMSVLDADIEKVDIAQELGSGFYYGDEHVSRVTLKIETIWLRAWTVGTMPKSVRQALGLPIEETPAAPPQG